MDGLGNLPAPRSPNMVFGPYLENKIKRGKLVIMFDLLKKASEIVFSKLAEKGVDYGVETVMGGDSKFTLETLEINLKSLIAHVSDIEEQIKNGEQSGKKKRKREVENWLKEVKIIESKFLELEKEVQEENFIRRFLRDQATKLNARLDKLVEQSRHFGELLLDVYDANGPPLLTSKLFGDAFGENVEKILQWVVDEKISMVGIYGMGGVGKTTFAKHVHNLLLERTNYRVYWVTVSQDFNINKLQYDIAKVIGLNISDENGVDQRAALLNQALSLHNDFVLILDDVWHNIDLEKVGNLHHLKGCRLIITTRSLEVCRRIGCHEIIPVQTLLAEEAWNLFKEILGQRTTLTRQVEEIAKDVVKVCGGLPLGIVTMAASMRGVTNIHVWNNTLTELKSLSQGDWEESVFVVLKYSFDRLDPKYHREDNIRNGYTNLQLCFLYCSLYPEDYKIDKDNLISRFISEKFIDKRKRRGEEYDLGHAMLDKLVNLCLLESTRLIKGSDAVKMHDLVRDMAHKITRDNPKFKILAGLSLVEFPREGEYWTEDLEKMSLMQSDISEIPEGMSPNCPKLSTLLWMWNKRLKFIPDSFFSIMSSLCVLDLSWTSITSLPNSLSGLKSLNSLILSYCGYLEFVPCLGELKALRELDLTHTIIKKVPESMENLVNLKYLSLNGVWDLEELPPMLLPTFQKLQYLCLPPHVQVAVEEVESLKHLEMLSCRVRDVYDAYRIIRRSGQRNITSFDIIIGHESEEIDQYPPERLKDSKRINMRRCNLKKREGNEESLVAQEIQELDIHRCVGLSSNFPDDLQQLGIAPRSIKSLRVIHCEGIECIMNYEFSSLELIILEYLPNLMSVVNDVAVGLAPPSIKLFSSLGHLRIFHCHKIKKLGLGLLLDNLQNLKYIGIGFCDEIEEIMQVADERRGGVVSLPKLKHLNLSHLPKLKSICPEEAKMCCDSIRNITLLRCPNVKKLPLLFLPSVDGQSYSPPPNLKEIEIEEERWESLKWDDPTHKDILQPFLLF
ncbi:hypothetical protein RD792_007894 [Penstemon davidsonii]|uniref:AAA+ ATPase domain-containing protein n=1 Tax=Penstemon davidsonii TaxID=160366 RepID=A0ABR0D7L8_9LAMI|nr:hypothetical protein RD792_007894 [Penstemon davidsonii]